MTRLRRLVSTEDWRLSEKLREREKRLLDVPEPEALLSLLVSESEVAADAGYITLQWQEACECRGYFRLEAQIPLTDTTFDQFFNGRSGYRAQYYLSPEEGILYNRDTLDRLVPAILTAYKKKPLKIDSLKIDWAFVEESMRAPHAKVWVFGEGEEGKKDAFDNADPDTLNPPRWVKSGVTRGRKVPLPDHRKIEVKGTFIKPGTNALFVDDLKLDRACDLFYRGFT